MNIIPVKNTLGWSAFLFCACEIIQLLCVVFFVFSAEQKCFFRLVINETLSKWHARGVNKVLHWYSPVFMIGPVCFPWPSSHVTIPTLWKPTAFFWVRDCDLALFSLHNYSKPFRSLIRRFCFLFGVEIRVREISLVLTSFLFVFL